MNKKVLIVAYYWPPAGGGGVQRWLKFSKYLVRKGWDVHVYTPSNADHPLTDESLILDIEPGIKVIKQSIFEPRRLFSKLSQKKEDKGSIDQIFYKPNKTIKQKLAIWIRANFFIPDARVSWVRKSVRFLDAYLKKNDITTIITTGPPHSMHLIGLKLKKKLPIKWLADFRDPWTSIEYFEHMPLTNYARSKHENLEREVLTQADGIITVSPSWKKLFEDLGGKNVHVITNGYDQEDFKELPNELVSELNVFKVCHLGTLAYDRNPNALWEAIGQIIAKKEMTRKFSVQLIGHVDKQIKSEIQDKTVKELVSIVPYMEHSKAIEIMRSSSLLLLLTNRSVKENAMGRIPGKVFEYFASGIPILFIGDPDSDVAKMIASNPGSGAFSFENVQGVKKFIEDKILSRTVSKHIDDHDYTQYERAYLTDKLIQQLDLLGE